MGMEKKAKSGAKWAGPDEPQRAGLQGGQWAGLGQPPKTRRVQQAGLVNSWSRDPVGWVPPAGDDPTVTLLEVQV